MTFSVKGPEMGIALLGQPAVLLPVLQELRADVEARFGKKRVAPGVMGGGRTGRAVGVVGLKFEAAKHREQYIVGRLVLGVVLEHSALEVLHDVGFAVDVRALFKLA